MKRRARPPRESEGGQQHTRSTIVFPYLDLDTAIEVAKAAYNRAGLGACDIDELAAEMDQSLSGAFRLKTATAKIFGVVDKDGRSAFKLTDLGRKIVTAETEREGRVEAFLSVPLYAAVYEKYRGHNLPPAKALEREMSALGVSSKQTDKARQAFERSASQAGFFESGKNRLVKPRLEAPGAPNGQPGTEIHERNDQGGGTGGGSGSGVGGGGGGDEPQLHPFIAGLLDTLPQKGSKWSHKDRAKWLQLAANAFDLIYEGDGDISVTCSTPSKAEGYKDEPPNVGTLGGSEDRRRG